MGRVENSHGESDVTLISEATTVDDEMFAVLSDEHRRFALYALLQFQRLTIEELTDIVTGWTNADGWRGVTSDERDTVLSMLYHNHVPMLEDAGYVEYDTDTKELSLAALPASLYDLVTYARRHERKNDGERERRDSTENNGDGSEADDVSDVVGDERDDGNGDNGNGET
ncbi:DUF7344 domain-containing protein [Haloprofundus salinisoli]|uniref:DUF7344 domain-containing protein n=1 Tax=Haloprofundus salinisoli TaxID=2876193 RepID=UPI001CCEAD16|nr:hypothetical protein [Haloprofundus salinisoli]